MHDSTLLSIFLDWKSGSATLEFRTDASSSAKITAHGVCELHIPRLNEWGASVSVNKMSGPSDIGAGRRELEIEMQSGDRIRIVAASFDFPASGFATDVGEPKQKAEEFIQSPSNSPAK